ncbi:MAG: glycosyltransferase family 61 protein [Gemmatimonadaceae bacterium]
MASVFQNSRRSAWLPLDSNIFGPPRHWSGTAAYCASHGMEWREVVPAGPVTRQPPRCVNYPAQRMIARVAQTLPAAGVASLENARVVTPHGWIIASDDTFLPDHCWYGSERDECPIYRYQDLSPVTHLQGTTLTLASDWPANYAHMLFDGLSRTSLFEGAGYSWGDVAHVLVPDLGSEGRRTAAQLCGLPMDRIVAAESFSVVQCDRLIAPTFPGVRRNTPPWVASFWRSHVSNHPKGKRRLFISRRGFSRNITNEDAIESVLASCGFETIVSSDRSVRHHYSDAEIIVGAHGAALGDVVFCAPGAVLIELTPPDHVYPYFYTAADSARMVYYSILGSYDGRKCDNPMTADFSVDPELLRATIGAVELELQKA